MNMDLLGTARVFKGEKVKKIDLVIIQNFIES